METRMERQRQLEGMIRDREHKLLRMREEVDGLMVVHARRNDEELVRKEVLAQVTQLLAKIG